METKFEPNSYNTNNFPTNNSKSTSTTTTTTHSVSSNNAQNEANNLARFQHTMVAYNGTIKNQCMKLKNSIDSILAQLPNQYHQKLNFVQSIIDSVESTLVDEFNIASSNLTQIFSFILNTNYAYADSNREQFGLLIDIGKATIEDTPNHVITYNDMVHFGQQGSQQPGNLSPFHADDQSAIGSIDKMV